LERNIRLHARNLYKHFTNKEVFDAQSCRERLIDRERLSDRSFFASEIKRLIAPIYRERDQGRMVLSDIDRNFSAI
jgi:hypothetical protein